MKAFQIDHPRLNQLIDRLEAARANYEILAHDLTIRTAEEGVAQGIGDLAAMAPTFILRAKGDFLAAIIRGDTRLSYKKIKRALGLNDLCLATPEEVKQITGAGVGYVSLVNAGMPTIIDSRVEELEAIYGGCGVPRFTLKIHPRDLIAITQAQVFDFAEQKDKR
jgi:Cys-tRNA(Pro)/Cys-tRNA(Cys) deacylase